MVLRACIFDVSNERRKMSLPAGLHQLCGVCAQAVVQSQPVLPSCQQLAAFFEASQVVACCRNAVLQGLSRVLLGCRITFEDALLQSWLQMGIMQ